MIEATVKLYFITPYRVATLAKSIEFIVLPRIREYVSVFFRELGYSSAYTVVLVNHYENGVPEILLYEATNKEGKSVYRFLEDSKLEEYLEMYKGAGWIVETIRRNIEYIDGSPIWQ
jgi:hypothetical protein